MPADLKSTTSIHFKGWIFLALGLICAGLIMAETLSYKVAIMLGLCIWAFCRFYYYAFYVIEKYVDSKYRFSGLTSFVRYLLHKPRDSA